MIGITNEYKAMFEVESQLWWYKILHKRVKDIIKQHFGSDQITILDAGCGTGGLMKFLQASGFEKIKGFDLSNDAVLFAQERGFDVACLNLLDCKDFGPGLQFDVIVCNDVVCYLDNQQIIDVLEQFKLKLKPNGIVITNNNALKAFEGLHSKVLKINRRFRAEEFYYFAQQAGFDMISHTYWPFLLSPLIWLYRKIQLLGISLGMIDIATAKSDVVLPSNFQNNLFFKLSLFEQKLIQNPPFGSSVFVVMKIK
jgi:SAM-dependent methyltransferase